MFDFSNRINKMGRREYNKREFSDVEIYSKDKICLLYESQ